MPEIANHNMQSLSSSSTSNIAWLSTAQEILSGLGLEDQSQAMMEATQGDELSKQELFNAIENYSKGPDLWHATQLINILDKELEKTTKEFNLAKNKQIKYKRDAEDEAKYLKKRSYSYQLLNWIYKGSKQFFGSDNANLAKHYEEIAKNRKDKLEKLIQYRQNLLTEQHSLLTLQEPQKKLKTYAENTEPTSANPTSKNEKIMSQFPPEYLLSNLNNQIGVMFVGENINDQSGLSISNVGDVNDDDFDDFIIGAPNANNGAGVSYLVFGTSHWTTPFNLSNLNGVNGVKFNGENPQEQSGIAVSNVGDINVDGHNDFAIGAYGYGGNAGAVYLIFGGQKNWTSPFNLGNLNGINGIKFIGAGGSFAGWSVNAAGDINDDGFGDFLIGATLGNGGTGTVYLVFGSNKPRPNPFYLDAYLDGKNVAKFIGETSGDQCGFSVSSAGDVNGDGYKDLLIGARLAQGSAGITYLYFGYGGNWQPIINLSTLNGANGVKFLGGHTNDLNGQSVSFVGDMDKNGLSDFVIGAAYDYGYAGSSYLILGHKGPWPALINLVIYLNGANGVKLTGENPNDESGYSVNAGDFNGDGEPDLWIGATLANGGGTGYAVLGTPGIWTTPISLSKLNGVNGIKFICDTPNIACGYFVGAGGDSNGDKITDFLLGGPYANQYTGVSYLLFGDGGYMNRPNPITLYEGGSYIFNNISLFAEYIGSGPEKIEFTVTNILHGHFEFIYQPTFAIQNFTQLQINSNQVHFIHDGSCMAPSYQISSNDGGLAFTPFIKADINFIPTRPDITINTLILNEGQPLTLTSQMLNTYDPGDVISNLFYTVTEIQHGQFALVTAPNLPITQFTQQQINFGQILFIPDNSEFIPSYTLLVQNSCGLVSNPSTAIIYLRRVPVLGNNQLTLTQGQTITLLLSDLNATNVNNLNLNALLQFIVSDAQHGHFEALNNLGTVINTFLQQNISDGIIQFIHDGRIDAPSYSVAVSDGILSSLPHPALINFNLKDDLSNDSNNLLKSILTWLLSAGTILGFSTFFIRRYFTNKNEEYFILKKDPVLKDNVIPIFNAIAKEIRCSGIVAYMSDETKDSYLSAIREIIKELDKQFERDHMQNVENIMKDNTKAERLKTGIAENAKFLLKDQFYNCCSCGSGCSVCASCSRFFCAETTPEQLRNNAARIARAVKSNLYNDSEDQFSSSNLDSNDNPTRSESTALILSGGLSLHRPLQPINKSRAAVLATSSDDANINIGSSGKIQTDFKEPLLPPSPLTPSWSAQRRKSSDNGSAVIAMLPSQTPDNLHADLKHSK